MSFMSKVQDSGGESSGGADNQNSDQSQQQQQGGGENQQQQAQKPDTDNRGRVEGEQDFKAARPDHVPEKFWDAEKNSVRVDDVLKSYGELEKQLTKAKEKPKAPEKYEYKTPEALRKDFGISETVNPEDKALVKFNEFAKAEGLTQDQYSKFMDFYLTTELEQNRAQFVEEFGKLGDEKQAVQRVKVLKQFGKQHLSKESFEAMAQLTNSAAAVKLFEELTVLATRQRQPVDENPKIDQGLSEKELHDMMKTDAYWDKKDPKHKETVHTVTEGFKRLNAK